MPEGRPLIPAELDRRVKVEAGHRCAIPTCRQTPVVIAHIVPYAKVLEHKFENLIALCPTCHSKYDITKEIDRKSMMIYKANLTVINSRYGDLEKRVLEKFASNPGTKFIELPDFFEILLKHMIDDSLLVSVRPSGRISVGSEDDDEEGGVVLTANRYFITPKGRDFVTRWVSAKELE